MSHYTPEDTYIPDEHYMTPEEVLNLQEGKDPCIRNISRKRKHRVLKIKYESTDGNGARLGLLLGATAGLGLGPGAVLTGFLGAAVGSAINKWITRRNYFDDSTNTFLGTSRDEAANKCNENGLREFRLCNFNKAETWFNKAYHTCSNDYSGEDKFKSYRNIANNAAEAKRLWNKGQYESSVSEFQRACNLSVNVDIRRVLQSCIVQVKQKQNESASISNQKGMGLFQNWNFVEAGRCFQRAFGSCTSDYYSKSSFSNNRHVAEVASQAQALLYRNEYTAALSKCQEAYNLIGDSMRDSFARFVCHIKSEQNRTASNLHQQGLLLFSERRFAEAFQKFKEAYDSCSSDCTFKSTYRNNMNIAGIMIEGHIMFSRSEYAAAISEFQRANRDAEGSIANVIINCIHLAKDKQNEFAANFYQQGLKSFREDRFAEASQDFEKAYHSCTNDCASKSKYINYVNVALIMSEGEAMFNRAEYVAAMSKFQEAFRNAESSIANVIMDCINLFKEKQNEFAANFYQQGVESFKEARLNEASRYFEKACHSCTNDCALKNKYQNARNIGSIASEAQVMFSRKKFDAAITKFREAYELSQNAEIKHYISVHIDKTNIAMANVAWNQGKLEWDKAWQAENANDVEEANTKFQEAEYYFNKATYIKHNVNYQNWQKASCFKIEGNKLFNEGIKLFEDSLLQEALSKLREAQKKFQQGFLANQDAKFSECENYVQSHIQCIEDKCKEIEETEEINTAMRALASDISVSLNRTELDKELQFEDQIHDSFLSIQTVSIGNGFS